MYEQYYGLRERPFDLTPNPRFLFLTTRHREALSTLQYGISVRKGTIVLLGQAGTGKTTLIQAVLESIRPPLNLAVYLSNPTLTRNEFYELLTAEFGLSGEAASSKARFLLELERGITERHRLRGVTALVIDEAQSLPDELLEEVRLLANIETATEKLFAVVLSGQPELGDRLEQPRLQQLKQRVALRCEIGPLDIRETAAYIAGRIRIAGGNATQVFTRDAVAMIFERSRGIPRTISVICDNALVSGFATDVKPVNKEIVIEVCRDLELRGYRTDDAATALTLRAAADRAASRTSDRRRPAESGPGALLDRRAPVASPPSDSQGEEAAATRLSDTTSSFSLFRNFSKRRGFNRS